VIKVVLFDLGDTLVVEEEIQGRHLQEVELQKVPYVDHVLHELKKRYKLGVVTNTTTSGEEHVRTALKKIGIERDFDVIVTSVDVGYEKPHEKIFLTALRKLCVKPNEAVMVGNRISKDVLGANKLGMTSILYKWNERYLDKITSNLEKPDYTIKSLSEILPTLSQYVKKKGFCGRIWEISPDVYDSNHPYRSYTLKHDPSRENK
jgi:HAD superfamily hydrolase (TIGR01662 family)